MAMKNKTFRIFKLSYILMITSCMLFKSIRPLYAQGINGLVDYSLEKRDVQGKERTKFTQIYNLNLKRRLPQLYDTGIKFEFRSETIEGEETRRTQLLPELNLNFGNQIMNYGMGWSKDNIEYESGSYTNERFYSNLKFQPKKLPNILLQYWTEKRDRSINSETNEQEHNLSFMEDYSLKIGFLRLLHSYAIKQKELNDDVTTTYELSNKARIGHRFSFLNDIINIGTRYEISHDKNKQDDGRKTTNISHNGNISIDSKPYQWMSTFYKFLFGLIDEKEPDNREASLVHNLFFLVQPHPFISTEVGGTHNRYTESIDNSVRDRTNYSLKIIPDVSNLFFDQNRYQLYPLKTWFLINRTSEKASGNIRERGLSSLLNVSTTIYRGIDCSVELGTARKKNYTSYAKELETWFDLTMSMKLSPELGGSVKQKNKWNRYTTALNKSREFEGEIETKLVYRPVRTFMISIGNTLDYGGEASSYEYTIRWRPLSHKTEINLQYESGDEDKEEFFLGQINFHLSNAMQLRFQYQYPTDDQKMVINFSLDF